MLIKGLQKLTLLDFPEKMACTVFTFGCNLRCPFCQNHRISRDPGLGRAVDDADLAALMLELQAMGAHNINLVTATHFLPTVTAALDRVKPDLHIPVIYNCGGYESVDSVRALADYVDVWLPDLKYGTPEAAMRCGAPADYPARALDAIAAMAELAGPPQFDGEGMILCGVIVRHLVLPGGRSAAASGSTTSSRFRSRWPSSRTSRSIRPRSQGRAEGSCAA